MRGSMEIWKKHTDEKFAHLKANAEKFQVEFDRCEFKNASCYQEVIDENVNPINLLSPGFKYTPTKTESVSNSTLVYHLSDSEKFIESFPMDSVTLKSYVLSNKIVLYVNRFDRDKYGFEVLDQ